MHTKTSAKNNFEKAQTIKTETSCYIQCTFLKGMQIRKPHIQNMCLKVKEHQLKLNPVKLDRNIRSSMQYSIQANSRTTCIG